MDHSIDFWTSVASAYAGDPNVVFEPYNEPFPANNADNDAAWMCWKNGCTANLLNASGAAAGTYPAVGMQALVDAIRGAGAGNVLLLGGVQYSNRLTQWTGYRPTDSLNNLAAAWHVYNFNGCKDATCWNAAPATLAATTPIVATEFGENDCMGTFVDAFLGWMDGKGMSYLAWTWNSWGTCTPGSASGSGGRPWALISSYTSPTPNSPFAQTIHDHFVGP
jgi:endoglucanase